MTKETKKKGSHYKYENAIGNVFGRYGRFVASGPKKPWIILGICVFVNLGLGLGMFRFDSISDADSLYVPRNSQTIKDKAAVKSLFEDRSGDNFYSYSQTDFGRLAEIIIRTKNDVNILTSSFLTEIKSIDSQVRTVVATYSGRTYNFTDICAMRAAACVVVGDVVLTSKFEKEMLANNITYPVFGTDMLIGTFGSIHVSNGILTSATMVRLVYHLRADSSDSDAINSVWEEAFITAANTISSVNTEIAYQVSDSLDNALEESTIGDIKFFFFTFVLMIVYVFIAGIYVELNCVAWRAPLSLSGVFATILSILAAFGFMSLVGIEFVNMAGVMPFLVIGIGIDDTFILLSGMADACHITEGPGDTPIEKKMYFALKHSGVAITITSITDFLAFAIGASSTFLSVQNFCLYTGFAVLFCYLNQLFFFVPCIAINERRVEANRHFLTFMKTKPKEALQIDGRGKCYIVCCAGTQPKNRDAFDSAMERYPKKLFQWMIRPLSCKIVILVGFTGYLVASIYGAIHLEQGLLLRNLAAEDHYFYKYDTWLTDYIPNHIPISFVIKSRLIYSSQDTQDLITSMLNKAHRDASIDDTMEINWLTAFQNDALYNTTSETAFVTNLMSFISNSPRYDNDVRFDSSNSHIEASRFYVVTNNERNSQKLGKMMLKMREIADSINLPVFPFHPSFKFFEHYNAILSATLQTVGIAVAAMTVVTIIFMPYPILVFLVILNMLMILVGIFGFMYYWNLSLSSITMVQLVMTVGFSVDFSAHICHAFISVSGRDKTERVHKALDRAGGPIMNAAFSSIVGILMLLGSSGYIFHTFFKVMFLVMLFGLLHSVLFLPVVLSLIGPETADHVGDVKEHDDKKGHFKKNLGNSSVYPLYVIDSNGKVTSG